MTKQSTLKTPHILNTSASILGICAMLITGLKLSSYSANTFLDELLIITSIFMYISCFLSYLSIRSNHAQIKFEEWADNIFMTGLLLLLGSMVFIGFTII